MKIRLVWDDTGEAKTVFCPDCFYASEVTGSEFLFFSDGRAVLNAFITHCVHCKADRRYENVSGIVSSQYDAGEQLLTVRFRRENA